jgi:hypothetical protein
VTDNLAAKTGRTLEQWYPILEATTLEKHSDLVSHLKSAHGISHGFANMIALGFRSRGLPAGGDDLLAAQYAGPKESLRPIHDRLVEIARAFGDDVEIDPKKSGVYLRRHRLFAVIEPVSARRIQLGLQLKGEAATQRLLTWGSMCSHKVNLATIDDIDAEVVGWMRRAYEAT